MTKKVKWRQADLERALKAMLNAGLDVSEIHIPRDGPVSMYVRGFEPKRD